jgi:hypothetical protein
MAARVAGHADGPIRTEPLPCLGDAPVLLPQMDAIRAKLGGKVGPVVDDEGDITR